MNRCFLRTLIIWVCVTFVLLGCDRSEYRPVKMTPYAIDGIYAADISADMGLSVVSSPEQGVLVWDLKQDKQLYQWRHSTEEQSVNTVTNVHISADSRFVATSDREAFALWDISNGEPIGFWRIDESTIRDIAVCNNGRGLLVGRGNGKVMFFEPETGRRLEFLGHQEKINSVDLSPNGYYALTGGNDYVAYLWDTRTGQVIHRFTHTSRVTKVALDDAGRYAFTADSKRDARVWDLTTGEEISNLRYLQRQKIFSAARFSEDGTMLLTGSPARRVNLWSVQSGAEIQEWKVAPKAGTQPQSAVVYGLGFVNPQQIMTLSSSGLAEYWQINP